MSPNTLATINKILLKFGHFVILNFEFAEYSRKIEKTIIKNQSKFEIFKKYIENSYFLRNIFISLQFLIFVIFCPEISVADRYKLYRSNTIQGTSDVN